jgi:hypothetical protein
MGIYTNPLKSVNAFLYMYKMKKSFTTENTENTEEKGL